jgi:E3 ubiquitin-protein ligase TRIP12
LTDTEDPDEDGAFEHLQRVVERLSASNASDPEYLEVLWELADLFASPHTSVSSFELLKSGIVDGLLNSPLMKLVRRPGR